MPLANKDSLQRNTLRWAFYLFVFEFLVVTLVIPPRVIKSLIDNQRTLYANELGTGAEDTIRAEADKLFKAVAIDSGFRDATFRFMLGQFSEAEDTAVLKLDDRGVKAWEDRQLRSIWGATYLGLYRWAGIVAWLPFVLPLAFAAGYDGWMRWKIGQWRFSFASPVRHGTSLHVIATMIVLALCLPVIPLAVTAYAAPFLLFVAAACCWVTVSNLPKRW